MNTFVKIYKHLFELSLDAPLERIFHFSCDQNFCLHHVFRTYYQKNKRINVYLSWHLEAFTKKPTTPGYEILLSYYF